MSDLTLDELVKLINSGKVLMPIVMYKDAYGRRISLYRDGTAYWTNNNDPNGKMLPLIT